MAAKEYARRYARSLRREIINAYGAICVCCGETRFGFLTLDHIHNNGTLHRKSLRARGKPRLAWRKKEGFVGGYGSLPLYNDLKRRGFPKDECRCLCYNCNMGRHRNFENPGICPHEIERGEITSKVRSACSSGYSIPALEMRS